MEKQDILKGTLLCGKLRHGRTRGDKICTGVSMVNIYLVEGVRL